MRVSKESAAMRGYGAHQWTDTKRNQRFWCFCDIDKDHKSEPRFEDKE